MVDATTTILTQNCLHMWEKTLYKICAYFTLQMFVTWLYLDKYPSRVQEGEHQEEGQKKACKGEEPVLTIGRLGKLLCMHKRKSKWNIVSLCQQLTVCTHVTNRVVVLILNAVHISPQFAISLCSYIAPHSNYTNFARWLQSTTVEPRLTDIPEERTPTI